MGGVECHGKPFTNGCPHTLSRSVQDNPAKMWPTDVSFILLVLPPAIALYQNGSVIAPCDSSLYCQGEILREIELAQPISGSKTHVDL